ncbi:receptor-like protein EIX1 [Humulus lupulus]|uniref:receptor-like protein EIX1 n=1 Tax=Humulus lupulus TaxID=3486 RepID=UPI002B4042AC|nr:receptor-like protein EIX1 [Humulus lupulus]
MALYNSVKHITSTILIILINIFLVEATFTNVTSTKKKSSSLCVENEKKALLSFKHDLVDPLNMLASWVANGDDCCKWTGIVCDNTTGHVEQLLLANHLYDQNGALSGKVNPSLLNLSYLTHLDPSYNNFGGTQIPSFFGSLTSLKYLNLTQAGFEGKIPHQLGNLSSLSYLILQSNYEDVYNPGDLYVDNLHWLSSLSLVEYLEMKANFSAATDWLLSINKLPSLLELHLSLCELRNIHPISHVNFSSLEVLDISENDFQSSLIPNWIFNLTGLVHLDLGRSYCQGSLPNCSKSLPSLKYVDLSQSNLNSLPDWFFNLKNMVHLTLSDNAFDASIMCHFHNMTFLKDLDLSGNYFSSTTPSCVYSYHSLEYLSLRFNDLHGDISSAIENLTSLANLDLSHNALEGKIPVSMGNLCNLQIIWLNNNKLKGEISEVLESSFGCDPKRLTVLNLDENFFSGELREDIIEKFQNLRVLCLKGNMLSGPIPASIGKLSALGYLSIGGNQFNGSLPESIGSLSSLNTLHIFDNLLEGNVSEIHFVNLTKLIEFYASGNSLMLSVKPDWIPPFRISTLDLRYWSLGPQFPRWLKSQNNFRHMDLSQTGISDPIPAWFWNLSTSFSYLNLSHNQINGRVPDMHFNSIIPSMIYLSSNKFEGPLPQISSFVAELDLSRNNLSGDW